jgi:hypothetical protein
MAWWKANHEEKGTVKGDKALYREIPIAGYPART